MDSEFIVTIDEARRFGLPRYFTGEPCRHGHIAERMTANRTCAECNQIARKRWGEENAAYCLEKAKEWRRRNPEKARDIEARKYAKHNARIKARAKQYKEDNPDRVRAAAAKWLSENRPAYRATQARRRARKLCASPPWLTAEDMKAIKRVYEKAHRMTKKTGILHHVDHIVPLQGRSVCGLHVPWNLQAMPARDNIAKGNKHSHE